MRVIAHDINLEFTRVSATAYEGFEKAYLNQRSKEDRLYPDNIVSDLPLIPSGHIHFAEWKLRQETTKRLLDYIGKKPTPLKILEVGCGNGWLSYRLSQLQDTEVYGLDVNQTELDQARRVFKAPKLEFIHADIDSAYFRTQRFDTIVFAASIQYFPSLTGVINKSIDLLNANGEIHIVDSFFYSRRKIDEAKNRTDYYYLMQGNPEMSAYYFHHDIHELETFDPRVMYRPTIFNKLRGLNSPFKWVCIKAPSAK